MNQSTDNPVIPPLKMHGPRPKVSVVTACYNALGALKETLDSVSSQDFGDVEHVVVDGGSTDGTDAYLHSLGDSVSWISEADDGIADAMNKGARLARGAWIIFLHAGDTFVDAHSLSGVSGSLVDDTDIVTCGIHFGSGSEYRTFQVANPHRRLLFKPIPHQGTFCRREVFEAVGGFDQSYTVTMDYDFFLRARGADFRFSTGDLVVARMDDTGVSSRRDWPSLKKRFAEERRTQLAHCERAAMRLVYAVYWPLYLSYRKARSAVEGG